MDGQLFCPDNSGYAEKRVQSYDFFLYLANLQQLSSLFLFVFLFSLLQISFFLPILPISLIYFVPLPSEKYIMQYEEEI